MRSVWYKDPQLLPVSLVVAVRSDLLYQLDELHKALGYALGQQEVFRLEKFTPTETANVLKAIARLEHLNFDSRFGIRPRRFSKPPRSLGRWGVHWTWYLEVIGVVTPNVI